MSVNFWNDLDAKLETLFTSEMGDATYGTLELQTVQVVHEWSDPPTTSPAGAITLPALFIVGREWEPGNRMGDEPQGPHAGGTIHVDIAYPYELIFVAAPVITYATALDNVKELARRVREALRSNWTLDGLTSTDGEVVVDMEMGRAVVDVRGGNGSTFLSAGYLPVTVYSEI